ncbi:Axin-2 [Schistosoma haematobium]|uniref:Axin-2 n=1 Tax=Schistosoma haematobium TaxID=6185 RepID=A0A922IID2_SCHHA|nr:Axin-2 [Schistosoma haematobium]KAH9580225.1 Axin-2 [Schistosoma haematobium]
MSYPPDASRSCHEADGRSDRSGGSGGATSGSGGVYGTLCSAFGGSNWSSSTASYEVGHDPIISVAPSNTNERMISNWKKWSLGLDYLLQDSEGVALFKSYLQYEGCANLLDFWFACQGFRSKVDPSDHRKITQLIKAIYRTYIRGSSNSLNSQPLLYLGKQQSTPVLQNRSEPIRLRSETRHAITERISRKHTLDQTVFDSAQAEVEHFLRTTAYPAFLKSDIYVDFLQTALEGSIRKFPTWEQTVSTSLFPYTGDKQLSTATNLPECPSNMALGGKVLPTLDEDRELQSEELSLLHPSRQACRPACCQILPLTDTAAVTPDHGHCQHCKKCQLYNPCLPLDYSQPILRPPSCYQQSPVVPTSSAAPLTMENLQMTRFYRTELSLQRSYFNPSQNPYVTRPNQEGEPVGHAHVSRACGSTPWRFHNRPNYAYTHWADAMCPPSMDPRLGNLPSQPPNPYHISYAPVSARDSEHHSLSSDARTDDTHSHTDSSHDGACNRLRALNHRYPSPFQSSRSHNNNNNSNNSKRQNQLSHHHHHHHQRHLSTGPQGNSSGVGELMMQCTSPKSSSFPTSFQSRLQQSNPFCRSPIGIGGAGGDSRINYPLETFSTNTSCPTSTAPFTTSNNGNNQGIGEKIAQHSTTDPIINNNKSQQQKHQRRLARRGISSRPFSDKTKLHNNNNYCTVGSAAAAAAPTAAAGNPTGLNVPVKPSNKSSTSRSYSMAEHDPKAFAQILSEKLQRLLNSQLVTERLDNLMIETSPNIQESQEQVNETTKLMITDYNNNNFNKDESSIISNTSTVITFTTTNCPIVTNTTNINETTTTTDLISTQSNFIHNQITSSITNRLISDNISTVAVITTPSVLQRPWADKLLAAARVQHENTRENAQAILEDHCSRIWAASADRTPSSGGGGGGSGDGSRGGGHLRDVDDDDVDGDNNVTNDIDHNRIGLDLSMHSTRPHDTTTLDDHSSQRNISLDINERSFISPIITNYNHESYCPSTSLNYNRPYISGNNVVIGDINWSHSTNNDLTKSQQTHNHKSSSYSIVENNWINDENTQLMPNNNSINSYNKSSSTIDPSTTKSLPVIVPPWFASFSQSKYSHKTSDIQLHTHYTEHLVDSNNTTNAAISMHDTDRTENSPVNIGSSSSSSGTTTTTTTTTTVSTTTSSTNDHHHQGSVTTNTTSQSTHSSSTSAVSGTSNSTPGSSGVGVCTSSNSLVIGYYMGDDPVPYRSLWPSSEITLGQFKQLIPKKKGLFRYFFKKASDEFDSGVVHQEITNDDTILPLWEGKIVAKVERID